MAPRLKLLTAGLCFSIIYAVYDYIDRNDIGKSKEQVQSKRKKKRARTAGVTRGAKTKGGKKKKAVENKNEILFNHSFSTISDEYSDLEGWARNPFIDVYEPKKIVLKKEVTSKQGKPEKQEKLVELNTLDQLKIETAVRMGDKAFVTINGQTFTEGDLINDALIERIENEQVTFKIGKTRIIKDVGT